MFRQEVGEAMVDGEAAAGADQLDLEAAEQLIQLSGGDGARSESRSGDSVNKCCSGANRAGGEEKKDKEVAVESRLRRSSGGWFPAGKKGGDGGEAAAAEPDRRRAGSVSNSKWSRADRAGRKEKRKEAAVESPRRSAYRFPAAGVVDGAGEERRRPRFRWLADLYMETRQVYVATPERRAAGGDDPPEGERWGKRKRAADANDRVSEASKKRTMLA